MVGRGCPASLFGVSLGFGEPCVHLLLAGVEQARPSGVGVEGAGAWGWPPG